MNEKRLQQRLKTFDTILGAYTRKEPFARFLSQYFKDNKQMGSSDRRIASRLTYNYFRLGNTLQDLPDHQKMVIAEFLCEKESDFIAFLLPELQDKLDLNLADKIKYAQDHFNFQLESLFPLGDKVSREIDKEKFFQSHLIQPDLFIQIHPGNEEAVKEVLRSSDDVSLLCRQEGWWLQKK